MLRIGEVAELAGVSTRTIRHYHQIGLLPEPIRAANGYRGYHPKDVVLVLRIRRLAETGLHLDEIKNVLAAERGREPRDILIELDKDLAEQERRIRARRKRIAELLAKQAASAYSMELAELLTDVERTETDQPTGQQLRTTQMFDALTAELASSHATTMADQSVAAQLAELSGAYHRLAGRPATDPAVADLARRAARLGPTALPQTPTTDRPTPIPKDPAQAECFRLLLAYLQNLTGPT